MYVYIYIRVLTRPFLKLASAINLLLLIPTSWRGSFYFIAKTRHKSVPYLGNKNELYHCFLLYAHIRQLIYIYIRFHTSLKGKKKNENSNVPNSRFIDFCFFRKFPLKSHACQYDRHRIFDSVRYLYRDLKETYFAFFIK